MVNSSGRQIAISLMLVSGLCPTALGQDACLEWSRAYLDPRQYPAMAYDSLRDRAVLFGDTSPGETWEWDGQSWEFKAIGGQSNLYGHAMAFDAGHGQCVVFGGMEGVAFSSKTWTWDGIQWTLKTTSGPSPRSDSVMAFDVKRGVVVLFGGRTSNLNGQNGETWEWDGETWTQRLVPGPPARNNSAMAYDPVREVIVLFGGRAGNTPPVYFNDTWEWDGNAWTEVVAPGPSKRTEHTMAFDPVNGNILLYGGWVNDGFPLYWQGDTWSYDGKQWIQQNVAGPAARRFHVMTATATDIVLFGGETNDEIYQADTWTWNGATWVNVIQSPPVPEQNWTHGMAYDIARGVTVLAGGGMEGPAPPNNALPTTWEFDGQSWTLKSSTGFSPRKRPALVYDANNKEVLMFGGFINPWMSPTTYFGDTLAWNGTSWTLKSTTGPAPRSGTRMAYDANRKVVVLFGGGGTQIWGDTWEWDGKAWMLKSNVGPSPRGSHALSFDPIRGKTVLFGGSSSAGTFNDTWEWDGKQWTQINVIGPSARRLHAMTFDPALGATVLFGGVPTNNETWTWNGVSWTQLMLNAPYGRSHHQMVFDEANQVIVMHGGSGTGKDTWTFGIDLAITAQPESVTAEVERGCVFTVSATGTAPITYQWFKDGIELHDDAQVSGAQTPSVSISQLVFDNAGTYSVIVNSDCGVLSSADAKLTVTLTGDITCNGVVDVDDVLAVINEWGACEEACPPHCAADIAPSPQGNCVVDVDDLLAVINNWSS